MNDHAISYIKCVSIPSENIKTQSKKNADQFLKKFKLHKCNLLAKLNKKQINKSNIIRYFKETIEQLNKLKKERLQKIILLTKDLFENISDDETDDITDRSDQCNKVNEGFSTSQENMDIIIEKLLDKNPIENEKLSERTTAIENKQIEIDLLPNTISRNSIADVMEIIEEDEENQKELNNGNYEAKIGTFPQIDITEQHENASSGGDSLSVGKQQTEMDKTFDMAKITIIETDSNINPPQFQTNSIIKSTEILPPKKTTNEKFSNTHAKSKLAGLNTSLNASKAFGSNSFKLPVKNPQLKTPQQPLYKSKYHPTTQGNSLSNWKANSLVKSQTNLFSGSTTKTLSSQMKPLTEIKKPQNKIEEEKRRKLEEIKAKRKENCMKLAEINESKKAAAAIKSKANCSSIKPGISNHASTLPAGWSMKSNAAGPASNLPHRPIPVNSHSHKPAVAKIKLNSIDKFPLPLTTGNQMPNALKPINADLNAKSNLTFSNNTGSQSSCSILSEFKTPFSKTRLTILSDSCKKIIRSHESYDLSSLVDVDSDEEEEDENHTKAKIPRWSRKENGTLERLVRYQMKHSNPSDILLKACHVMIDYNKVFREGATINPGVLEEWL